MKMTITVELTESEICEILTAHFHHQYSYDANIQLILPNIVSSVDHKYNARVRILDRIKENLPKTKITAIKELRIWSEGKYDFGTESKCIGLKDAKDFVEKPELWEEFLKSGYLMSHHPI